MTEHSYTLEVQSDFLERQSKAKPVLAVAELVWNGLDADATRVDVQLEYGELGMTKIVVRDYGHSIPYEDAPQLFTRLGGTWTKPGGHRPRRKRGCCTATKGGAGSRSSLSGAWPTELMPTSFTLTNYPHLDRVLDYHHNFLREWNRT